MRAIKYPVRINLIPLIDHVNVACGFHVGDLLIMQQTVLTCKKITSPQREIKMTPEELTAAVRYQVGDLEAFWDTEGMPLHHVKHHRTLYIMMYRNKNICRAVYQEEVAKELGLPFTAEIYSDVKYNADKTLVIDRQKKLWQPNDIKKHVRAQIENASVTAVTGEEFQLPLGDYPISLCCHSDSPGAVAIVTAAREIVDEFNTKYFLKSTPAFSQNQSGLGLIHFSFTTHAFSTA
ncbi:uncharacterized protein BDR25DRAFT_397378 [Lindgomyces ingoldianus]|uniref:Uncharacterized protein n=1 Tax=Lindgomyces ingoldianus TaxID=673940 RepID=A0ACB6QA81_9PLEO|nr:uncharacterized protein BDR25DRAFT_397378 [Lindgomyces ingoldianus]KAF2463041.1 hypothetical protein BDR25DRAFT_397378 [Lindgomyces ingoldianus]